MSHIHPSAVVDPGAWLGEGVRIGPFCTVGPHVKIGAGTELISHVTLDGHTRIGENCRLFPHASIGLAPQDLKYTGGITFVEIGDGATVRECVTVHAGSRKDETTRVGANCLLMAYSHVAHGCVLGDEVIVSNATQLAGNVTIESRAILSGLVAVHQFSRLGTMAMIGGLSRVSKDAPPFMITDGHPAIVRGPNTVGMQRRGVLPEVRSSIKQAYRLLHRSGLATGTALRRIREEVPDSPEIRHLIAFYESTERGVTR